MAKIVLTQLAPTSVQFTFLLGLVAGLPALSIDLSAPTLAILPAALNTTVFAAGLSLSLFVLGFGLGQFVGGRASDRVGRRPILVAALSIYAFAGVCCALATTGGELATSRLIQGLGAGACAVQSYAIVQDLFVGEAARRKQASVSVVLTLLPMLAPAIGAVIVMLFGWRSVHVTMAAGGLLLLFSVAVFFGESRPPQPSLRTGLGFFESVEMLQEKRFRRIVLVNALSYASIFAYIAGAPVVIIAHLGYGSTAYSLTFAITAASLGGGAIASAKLAKRVDCARLVWPALLSQAVANVGLVLVATMLPPSSAWVMLPLLMIGCFARGIISPNLVHAAISTHRERAGLAAALVGLAQLVTASGSSAVLARELETSSTVSVAMTMACLTAGAVMLWVFSGLGSLVAKHG